MTKPLLTLYAICDEAGRYFRPCSYGGYGRLWVDSLEQARIWTKPAPAKGKVTSLHRRYPTMPVPLLVELYVLEEVVVDQEKRVSDANIERDRRVVVREVNKRKSEIERARAALGRAQSRLAELGEKP